MTLGTGFEVPSSLSLSPSLLPSSPLSFSPPFLSLSFLRVDKNLISVLLLPPSVARLLSLLG